MNQYKPRIDASKSTLIIAPIFRFKHVKNKVGDPRWSHYEKLHWKLQVAYSINTTDKTPDWFDVIDEYFYDDGVNTEVKISIEEYRSDDIN